MKQKIPYQTKEAYNLSWKIRYNHFATKDEKVMAPEALEYLLGAKR